MKINIIRRLVAIALLGLGGYSAIGSGSAVSARPMIDPARYVLYGTGPFSNSAASAIVTRLAGDRFRLALTAERLPPPTTLHVKFARHAYVAWLVNGVVMRGPMHMTAVGLAASWGSGNYAGQGTVTIGCVTSVIVTAEPTAQVYMPIMPVLTVLSSTGHQM